VEPSAAYWESSKVYNLHGAISSLEPSAADSELSAAYQGAIFSIHSAISSPQGAISILQGAFSSVLEPLAAFRNHHLPERTISSQQEAIVAFR